MFIVPQEPSEIVGMYRISPFVTQIKRTALEILSRSDVSNIEQVLVFSWLAQKWKVLTKNTDGVSFRVVSRFEPAYALSAPLIFVPSDNNFQKIIELNNIFMKKKRDINQAEIDKIMKNMVLSVTSLSPQLKDEMNNPKSKSITMLCNEKRKQLIKEFWCPDDHRPNSTLLNKKDIYFYIFSKYFMIWFQYFKHIHPIRDMVLRITFRYLWEMDRKCAEVFFLVLPNLVKILPPIMITEPTIISVMMSAYNSGQDYNRAFIIYMNSIYAEKKLFSPGAMKIVHHMYAANLVHANLFDENDECHQTSIEDCSKCSSKSVSNNMFYMSQYQCSATCKITGNRCGRVSIPDASFCNQHLIIETLAKHTRSTAIYNQKFVKHESPYQQQPLATKRDYREPEDENVFRHRGSKRPITKLTPDTRSNIIASGYYMPVYRIDSLYHDKHPHEEFCGKFFFYERASTTLMHLGNFKVYASKVDAYMRLLQETSLKLENRDINEVIGIDKDILNDSDKMIKLRVLLLDDYLAHSREILSALHVEAAKLYICDVIGSFYPLFEQYERVRAFQNTDVFSYFHHIIEHRNDISTSHSDGTLHYLFPTVACGVEQIQIGQLDYLDQPICRMGKFVGLDTIILQHEVGSHDCVTELLSCRPNAYESLVTAPRDIQYSRSKSHKILSEDDIFNKIWFPRSDYILFVDEHGVMKPKTPPNREKNVMVTTGP